MDPWKIIGWFIIMAGLFLLVGTVSGFSIWFIIRRYRYYKTRNTPPQIGQIWVQGSTRLRISSMYEGRITLSCSGPFGSYSWSDSPEDWQKRVRIRKLWLQQ